jgi:hypothetical protein
MTKPTSRTLIVAPIIAVGLTFVMVQAVHAARGLPLDQRIDDAKGAVQDLVHVGASRVAEETESPASSEPTRAKPVRSKPARVLQADRRLARPGYAAPATRRDRGADTLPKRRLRGQSVPDFAAMQEEARKQSNSHVGAPSGRRPLR